MTSKEDRLKKLFKSDNKSTLVTSKKYAGLDPFEIIMYQTVEQICTNIYEICMPHDLLMVILLYSQGFKFEHDDLIITFPSGIFGASQHCIIDDTIEDNNVGQLYAVRVLQNNYSWTSSNPSCICSK